MQNMHKNMQKGERGPKTSPKADAGGMLRADIRRGLYGIFSFLYGDRRKTGRDRRRRKAGFFENGKAACI